MNSLRPIWSAFTAIHAVGYFAPEAAGAYAAFGYRTYFDRYFATRALPLGSPGPEVVAATFYGFNPATIAAHIPRVWADADLDALHQTRLSIATTALTRSTGELDPTPLADALTTVVEGIDFGGAPLAAAHAAQPRPRDPVGRLWHAATVLREYRGDRHISALVANRISGLESIILHAATAGHKDLQRRRGWNDSEWNRGTATLVTRGWVREDGSATAEGVEGREKVEVLTDELSDPALALLVDTPVLASLVLLSAAIQASGALVRPPD